MSNSEKGSPLLPKFKPFLPHEIVTLPTVQEIIHSYSDKTCKVQKYSVKPATERGDNYCSLIYAVEINYTKDARCEIHHLPCIIKSIPRNPFRVKQIKESKLFEKEIKMYREVLQLFEVYQEDFNAIPKCYHSFYDSETDYIALENLKLQGFKMLKRYDWLDLAHAHLAVQELAKFHAISFVKWNGNGNHLLGKFPFLSETVWVTPDEVSPSWKIMVTNTFKDLSKLLIQKGFEFEGAALLQLESRIFEEMAKAVTISEKYPTVILHGDAWSNNFLFRYDETGKPENMKILDFQAVRAGSRIFDLAYLLYTSLQISVMSNHFEELLRSYFDSFSQFSSKYGSNSSFNNHELSWEYFMGEWDEYKQSGLMVALLLLPAMCADPKDIPDFEAVDYDEILKGPKSKDKSFENFLKSEETVKRTSKLIQDFILNQNG